MEKHFNPKMEEFAKQKGLTYHYQESWESYVIFYLENPKWQDKCQIRFTFENKCGCYYGLLYSNPNSYRISDENIKIIHEQLKSLGVVPSKDNCWAFYAYIENLSLNAWENDIINDKIFFKDCKEKIEKLLEAMESIEL